MWHGFQYIFSGDLLFYGYICNMYIYIYLFVYIYIYLSRKLAVASWSLSCFSKEGGSPGPECYYLIYQDYTPPPRGVQLHPSPPRYLLLLLLGRCCCCLLLACCCWMLAACCLLSAPFCCCCCLGLLAAVGAEESLFVRIESSCIPSES